MSNNKICYRCFHKYDSEFEICPHCGQIERFSVSEPQYLKPGTVLRNRYILGVTVGAGGFGTTYAAWDRTLKQRVAIKEYLPGEFSTRMPGQTRVTVYGGEKTEQFRAGKNRFCEESRKLARFQEIPGIVHIYNSFEENGTAYIVMEFLEGETLAERLKRDKKIPEQEAVQIMLPVLRALEKVHKEEILHRDIAPNNIFLTNNGEVKLLDFGAARSVTGTHSKSLTVLYKEGYTAEEQYRSRSDQGTWTDVYSCAATLYHMLTGKVPPGALERRRKDTLKEPSRAGAKISPQADKAIMNALNVDIRHRTQTAEQFLMELTGQVKVKEHFVRTMERKIGRIPISVFILGFLSAVGLITFLVMLFTGVIRFEIADFGNFGVPEGKSRIPNIVNRSVEQSRELLEDRNLKIKIVDKQYSEEIPKDKILTQSVEAGWIVDQGTEIQVVVSGGAMTAENGYELKDGETFVPDVQYKDLEDALILAEEAGLIAQVEYERNDMVEAGKIISQNLEAGTVAARGDALEILVSQEEEPEVEEEQPEQAASPNQNEPEDNNNTAVVIPPEQENNAPAAAANEEGLNYAEGQALLAYVNQYRAEAGVPALSWNDSMAASAQSLAARFATGSGTGAVGLYMMVGRQCNGAKTASKAVSDWITGNAYIPSEAGTLLYAGYSSMGGALYYLPSGGTSGYKYYWVICIG